VTEARDLDSAPPENQGEVQDEIVNHHRVSNWHESGAERLRRPAWTARMVLLPPVSLLPLIPPARMRAMHWAAAAMNRDNRRRSYRRCAFDYHASPLFSSAIACRRSFGFQVLNGHLTEIVRAQLRLRFARSIIRPDVIPSNRNTGRPHCNRKGSTNEICI
jgi:hypothetical protein